MIRLLSLSKSAIALRWSGGWRHPRRRDVIAITRLTITHRIGAG
jgi:hypothetical protein